jgi:hypothetical protein
MGVSRAGRARGRAEAAGVRGTPLRIAALYAHDTANAHYRSVLPLRELERRGHRVMWPGEYDHDDLLAHASQLDLVHIHHFFSEHELALVEQLRRRGVAVVWDKDDDIAATVRRSPAYKAYGGRRGVKRSFDRSVRIAAAASLMTTPSAHLADRYRDEGVEHVEVIENYVAPEHVGGVRPRHPGIVIGITAAGEHGEDFKRLRIDKTLRRLLGAHAGVRVVTFGVPHDLPSERHTHRVDVPIDELIAAEREFDIGLAPLADTAFSRARSNVKVKEYAAAGAMWLASPVGPYRGMGEQEGGMLVEDGGWYDALERFVVDYRQRVALMERARGWVGRQSSDHAATRWEAAFRAAVARARAA